MKNIKNLIAVVGVLAVICLQTSQSFGSSHREAPLISNDPLADNTDLYAFKSPNNAETVVLIANYIPFQHPAGGPNWYSFGERIRAIDTFNRIEAGRLKCERHHLPHRS